MHFAEEQISDDKRVTSVTEIDITRVSLELKGGEVYAKKTAKFIYRILLEGRMVTRIKGEKKR